MIGMKSRVAGSRYAGKSDVKTLLFYIRRVFNILLDFIWPQFCLGCQKEGSICCGFCLNDIILDDIHPIKWPDKQSLYFENCYTCCDYQNQLVQKLIKYYKYSYLENLADVLVDILEKQTRRIITDRNTVIVNVPLHAVKKRQRGFDQTEILSKKLAQRLSLNYSPLLIRVKNNPAQAKLSKIARQQNVLGIFEINPSTLPLRPRAQGREVRVLDKKATLSLSKDGLNILLIDDVTTTGSTLNQAAKTLHDAGFEHINCLVLAKNRL